MKVAICDDNTAMLDFLSVCVAETLKKYNVPHEISCFSGGKDFVEQHNKTPFEVIFLDIKMPDIDGFEVANNIRRGSDNTQIIFVTTEDGLVYDSFNYQPFWFVPKTDPEILKAKLQTVIKKLTEKMAQNRRICLKLPRGEERYIYSDEILYLYSQSNYLNIMYGAETINIREKISVFSEKLPPQMFARIHNRYIVNMQQIAAVDYTDYKIILKNDETLYVSRAYKAPFLDQYNLYQRNFT